MIFLFLFFLIFKKEMGFNFEDKILTGHYRKLRNIGLYNHSDLTDWEYEYANLSAGQGDGYGPFDENDIIDTIGNTRLGLRKVTIKDYPRND